MGEAGSGRPRAATKREVRIGKLISDSQARIARCDELIARAEKRLLPDDRRLQRGRSDGPPNGGS